MLDFTGEKASVGRVVSVKALDMFDKGQRHLTFVNLTSLDIFKETSS